ncbi:hypothetical protein [Xanthocytophaga agilis]|uniref:Uncharacterized protein n=1 Tax=Xanthocytophaga agilis TaxID=3048010 RepID=A0AAE3UFQ8_9BACT|nr:hypothetical protein [Xanthocytophaga agilis]MDJ1503535.1 hypothetical protein [Xanthocytophaga agilis]
MKSYHSSKKYPGLLIEFIYNPVDDDISIVGITAKSDTIELLDFFEDKNLFENIRLECWEFGRDEYRFSDAA